MSLRPVLAAAAALAAAVATPSSAQPDAVTCLQEWSTRPLYARPLVSRDGYDVTIHGSSVVGAVNYEIDAAQRLVACLGS